MKKLFSMLACAAFMAGFTSCIKDTDQSDSYYYNNYFTITGSVNEGYICYSDGGDVLYPETSSITSYLGNTGFGNIKRAYLIFNIVRDNIEFDKDNHATIKNAELITGKELRYTLPMSTAMADSLKVNVKDSIWDFTLQKSKIWVVNGFINLPWSGYYSYRNGNGVDPTLNLVYDENKIEENRINFMVYYNRHDTMPSVNYGSIESISSFDVESLMASVPGKDSIDILIQTPQGDSIAGKMPRIAFKYPY